MALGYHSTQKWVNRKAVVISGAASTMNEEIKERLSRRDWQLLPPTFAVERAMALINQNKASMIVIEDSPFLPAPYVLRQLMAHKLSYLTPIIATTNETNTKEKICFSSFLPTEFVTTPVVPSKFVEMFEWTVHKWSIDTMGELRKAGLQYLQGNVQTALKMLTQMANMPEVSATIAACLALFFREHGDIKTAEKVLLSALKQTPRNMAVTLGLVDLYAKSAMPLLALRLLSSANATYAQPVSLAIDTMQCHLMLNQVEECIAPLKAMVDKNFLSDTAKGFLLRVLYAAGHTTEFKEFQQKTGSSSDHFQRAWSKQESPLNRAV